jgi:hypothetical protein
MADGADGPMQDGGLPENGKPDQRELNLADSIHRHFVPFGGVDLEPASDEPVGIPHTFDR